MKGEGIIHPQLLRVLAEMGHTDGLVICDAGLPIPREVERVDLALSRGVPPFLQVVQGVAAELRVERLTLAEEIRSHNPQTLAALTRLFPGVPVEFVPHRTFKERTRTARAAVRTGEFRPYANVILWSGVAGLFG